MLGVGACGGIEGTRRFVGACVEAGVGFWFYSGDLGIATAAQLHVTAALAVLEQPSQTLLRWYPDDVIVEGPFVPHRGHVTVPSRAPDSASRSTVRALARATERFARDGPYDLYTAPPLPHH